MNKQNLKIGKIGLISMKRLLISLFTLLGLTGCPPRIHDFDSQSLLALHNEQRTHPLILDQYLVEYAQDHAEHMARTNSLNHSDISVLMGRYSTAGENIAWNQTTEAEVFKDWMESPGHRANILNTKFTRVGFGSAKTKNGNVYWCAVFGG